MKSILSIVPKWVILLLVVILAVCLVVSLIKKSIKIALIIGVILILGAGTAWKAKVDEFRKTVVENIDNTKDTNAIDNFESELLNNNGNKRVIEDLKGLFD